MISETSVLAPGRRVNPTVVRRMVDRLVLAATGKPDVASAWGSLVKKTDIVGIKVAASGGPVSGTNPEVVDAIVDGLAAAGVPASHIVVWDKSQADLVSSGYRRDGKRYQLEWIDAATGYNKNAQVTAPVLGKLIWGDSTFDDRSGGRLVDVLSSGDQLSNKSFYSKVLSERVTKVINVPSLMDSFLTGVNGAVSNMVLGNLDNWRRFTKAPAFGDPYLAEIYSDAMIKDKVVFTILDGLVAQYAGGPFPNPAFLADNFTLYAGFDPVAIDATAARLLDELRKPSKLPPVQPMVDWLKTAEEYHLGRSDESQIDLIELH